MGETDGNVIFMEPLKSGKDHALTSGHRSVMLRLERVGIFLKQHILNNEVSEAMKNVTKEEYDIGTELVPPYKIV